MQKMNAKVAMSLAAGFLLSGAVLAGEFTSTLVGRVTYNDTNGWTIKTRVTPKEAGIEEWHLAFSAAKPSTPPRTTLKGAFPLKGVVGRWTTGTGLNKNLPPDWGCRFGSSLGSGAPVLAYFSDANENRGTIACSEAFRQVNFKLGIIEETAGSCFQAEFFTEPEEPLTTYEVTFRLDFRPIFYADAIRAAFAWYATMPEYQPAKVPDAAFEPLYSAWYSFHQNVSDKAIEAECARAVKYGMKVLIVDDGWQTDDNNRGYAFCGDWQVSKNRFPDFATHIKKVQALGMKYMIWFAVPQVGSKSQNFARFKDKMLYGNVLDPRFPEVREFLCITFENAMKNWGLDGLKLDFIDNFHFSGSDPALKDNYAGRDIKSLSVAIDTLMKEVHKRITAIKPDALIEFRQSYIGPCIRQYGNMLRAGDCPMDPLSNRTRTLDLRLSSGNTAVHSDMLMWNKDETPEQASRQFWSIMFAVPQISVKLDEIPESHRVKLHEMLDFWVAHRDTLMKGELRPLRPDLNYPAVYAYGKGEQVIAIYDAGQVVEVDRTRGKNVFIVNATDATSLVVREDGKVREVAVKPCSTLAL